MALPTVERRDCVIPAGWTIYTAQDGDTLYAIATAVDSSVEALREANCLGENENIRSGLSVYVPNVPSVPVATQAPVVPTATGTVTVPAPEGCAAPGVRIISPEAGQEETGTFALVGAAALPASGSYLIAIRPDAATAYTDYSRSNQTVVGGVLAQINSDLFGDGLHWIRLTVLDRGDTAVQACAIPVFFR